MFHKQTACPGGWANRAREGGIGRDGPGTVAVEAGVAGAGVARIGDCFDESTHFFFTFFLSFPSIMRHDLSSHVPYLFQHHDRLDRLPYLHLYSCELV